MVKIIDGKSGQYPKRIGIVVSLFNDYITKRLLSGCLHALFRSGVKKKDVTVIWVPGAFEIPITASKLAKKRNIDAVICLGAVIRGETMHFNLVAQGAAQGIMQASLMTGKPVIFGVLATDTVDRAYKRADEKGGNKGGEAAQAAVVMIDVLKQVAVGSKKSFRP
jgi:6,7-dimethyl-8-ribityllumazine synthase